MDAVVVVVVSSACCRVISEVPYGLFAHSAC